MVITTFCVELKVCEACGALWLRKTKKDNIAGRAGGVYCGRCVQLLSEFPMARGLRRKQTALQKSRRYGAPIAVIPKSQCVGGAA